jgi:hypothetical protein
MRCSKAARSRVDPPKVRPTALAELACCGMMAAAGDGQQRKHGEGGGQLRDLGLGVLPA